jgi:Macoilin family
MQEKNAMLEKNLSAETRVKLDLFSALGEARRQLEIKDSELTLSDQVLSRFNHDLSFQTSSGTRTNSSKT